MLHAGSPRWRDNDPVFCNCYGGYLIPHKTLTRFHELLKKAGLPRVRMHDLRHGSASLLILVLKMPPKLIQELLGHSRIEMTLDLYTHSDEW